MKIKYLSILSVLFLIVENNGFTMDGIYNNNDNITEYDEDDFIVIDKKSNNNKKSNNSNTLRRANRVFSNNEILDNWVDVGEYNDKQYSDDWVVINKKSNEDTDISDDYVELSSFQDDDVSVLDADEDYNNDDSFDSWDKDEYIV